ncbi:MAG: hypothetical protein KatS3mg121_0558 [Gammaproteobacteria bacterium]|nr:MAG: hypothetical protein KatS3mg121_0558 [Gammaproteobacteria bacterium]
MPEPFRLPRPSRALATLLLSCAAGCASLSGPPPEHDPWERFNRSVFAFNESLDRHVLEPVARGYRRVTPDAVETGIANVFANLGELRNTLNNLLQGKPGASLGSLGRFLVNGTLGLGGLFDVATPLGLERHDEDFGQTLGRWGIGPGPYLVLPLLGPSTLRDGGGRIADRGVDLVRTIEDDELRWGLRALDAVQTRARLLEAGELLDEAALDPYVFTREAYLQRRRAQVHDGAPPPSAEDEAIDIFSDE